MRISRAVTTEREIEFDILLQLVLDLKIGFDLLSITLAKPLANRLVAGDT